MINYILDKNGEPKAVDYAEWIAWFEDWDDGENKRRVAYDKVGPWEVSTVFLSIDHNFIGRGKPILWETMVFGPEPWSEWQRRYSSREDAVHEHNKVVEAIKHGEDVSEYDS